MAVVRGGVKPRRPIAFRKDENISMGYRSGGN
jgi:hypothetical protein